MPNPPTTRNAPLNEHLEAYKNDTLKGLARHLGTYPPTRKADLIDWIQQRMLDPTGVRQLWDKLDRLQQQAVAETLYAADGRFDRAAFRAKHGADPNWGERDQWGGLTKPSALSLFVHSAMVPADLAALLMTFVAQPAAARIKSSDTPMAALTATLVNTSTRTKEEIELPMAVVETEQAAQQDLHAVLRLIEVDKIKASETTRLISAAGAKAIAKVLHGGDFYESFEIGDPDVRDAIGQIKPFAWPLILQSAGLVELAGGRLQLTAAGQKALETPPHQTIRKAWQRWQKNTLLDEFYRIDEIKGQKSKGQRVLTAPAGRRAAIVQALGECPTGRWIDTNEFSRYMQAAGHRFEVARDLWALYITDRNYGSLGYAGHGDWHIVQKRYLLAYLFEYAATLGLIDVVYVLPNDVSRDFRNLWGVDDLQFLSRYDGLLQFRINNLGAWCLGLTAHYVPTAPQAWAVLQVLPNGDIVASAAATPGDLLLLGQFAERSSDFVWRLAPLKLLEVVEQGRALAGIVAFLEARSQGPLPQNVAADLAETARRLEQLTDRGPARLLEVQDPITAQLIANDSRLRSLCLLTGERHLVVLAENEKAFRRGLREMGYAWAPAR
jgi:hypothetical protein